MECYACEQAATQQCSRCGKAYCPNHGDDPLSGGQGLCAECLNPLNAAPSGAVFRASLFALLIASVVALWLLIRPPDLPGEAGSAIRPEPTDGLLVTPTPAPGEPTETPGETTPAPEETATPAAETPVPERVEYTVVEGDTWFGIAEIYGVSAEDLAAVNGLTLEDFIQPGDVLVIP
jgi:hypothetical protein